MVDIVTLLSSACLCNLSAQRLGNNDTAVWEVQKQSTFESQCILSHKAKSLTLLNPLCLCWHFPIYHLVSAHMSSLKLLMLSEDEMKNMRRRSITAIWNICTKTWWACLEARRSTVAGGHNFWSRENLLCTVLGLVVHPSSW